MPAGTVTTFDEQRGLGIVTAAGSEYPFHTTQIADGSRTVRVGQAVTFEVVPGRRGDWEAAHIEKHDDAVNTWQVGDVRITSVVELELPIPVELVLPRGTTDAVLAQPWLQPDFATGDGLIHLRIQLLVVESVGLRIAVDTCVGNDKDRTVEFFHRMQLPFLDAMEAAGFPPESIDTVVCTHLHQDHVGWNTRWVDGSWVPTFPNARYQFGRIEAEHWDAYGVHEDGDVYGDSVRPVVDAGLVDLVEFGHHVTDEVVMEPTPGHSPGHQSVHITSAGAEALITGDVLHHPLQCADPELESAFDSDIDAARATRRALLGRYAGTDVLVIGTHFGGRGAGHLVADGDTWRLGD